MDKSHEHLAAAAPAAINWMGLFQEILALASNPAFIAELKKLIALFKGQQ